jgi:hypothetical protein
MRKPNLTEYNLALLNPTNAGQRTREMSTGLLRWSVIFIKVRKSNDKAIPVTGLECP